MVSKTPSYEVRISDGVTLLRAPNEPARVYLIAARGRIAIVACVKGRIAGAGTQRHGWKP